MLTFHQRLKAINFDFAQLPDAFKDCVHLGIIENPVILSDGHTYDESTAIELLSRPLDQRKSPKTREPLKKTVQPSNGIKTLLMEFVEEQEKCHKPCIDIAHKYKSKLIKLKESQTHLLKDHKKELNQNIKQINALQKANEQLRFELLAKKKDIMSTQSSLNHLDKKNKELSQEVLELKEKIKSLSEKAPANQESWLSLFNIFKAPSATGSSQKSSHHKSKHSRNMSH